MTYSLILGIIFAFIFAIFLLGYNNNKTEQRVFRKKCADEYGAAPSSRLKKKNKDVSGFFKAKRRTFSVDDITWNDLMMEDVYDRINYCESSSGEEYLYYLLRCPEIENDNSFSAMEKSLKVLEQKEDERICLKESLHRIGKAGKYSLWDYLPLVDKAEGGSNLLHITVLFLYAVSVIVMAFMNFMAGFLLFIILVGINIVSYFKVKGAIDPYLTTFSYVLRLVRSAGELKTIKSEAFFDEIQKIDQYESRLKPFKRGSWILMSGGKATGSSNPIDILLDYVRMTTHLDLIKFNSMYKKLKKELESVEKLTALIGYIDTCVSVAYYRASLSGGYCIPAFDDSGIYSIKAGRHPLMEKPVPNSFEAEKGFLITGSNASGKSTFLKMCAINTIFAQTIHTCLCDEYRGPFYRVYTSMALKDNLKLGDSYYMVEIKSLKRILDAAYEQKTPVLCFIDEVLRGTNTVERIAASSKILEFFAQNKERIMCFAATHDGELSDILGKLYDVHHFEGEMNEGDVIFDYKLKTGPATKRNAISLLRTIGYNDNIVNEAESMAARFEEKGIWNL
ncbi:MutS-related protein [Butyrivibrio sp. AC2005]|uniref:MutS-related protein n=1 Tax=Butyrivibrio sp. AC2005 TaxID=1280672 RepID=UPI0004060B1A|nr:MutS family DNA mismatch repair protein [Butyrivibrio sp. AC2005]